MDFLKVKYHDENALAHFMVNLNGRPTRDF
jgi:hypothetical protein